MRHARTERRQEKRELKHNGAGYVAPVEEYYEVKQKKAEPLRALNQAQYDYIKSIENNVITFGVGPAGTGKTFCATSYAADLLAEKTIEKIIVCRPGVEVGRSWGALPGELREKYLPFIEPVLNILEKRLGKATVGYHEKRGNIEFKPLEYLRGATFDDSFVILDEAQNTTCQQMLMFLSRVGENTTLTINGDLQQKDIREKSGLHDAITRLERVAGIGMVQFDMDDCVRSGLALEILRAYQ